MVVLGLVGAWWVLSLDDASCGVVLYVWFGCRIVGGFLLVVVMVAMAKKCM